MRTPCWKDRRIKDWMPYASTVSCVVCSVALVLVFRLGDAGGLSQTTPHQSKHGDLSLTSSVCQRGLSSQCGDGCKGTPGYCPKMCILLMNQGWSAGSSTAFLFARLGGVGDRGSVVGLLDVGEELGSGIKGFVAYRTFMLGHGVLGVGFDNVNVWEMHHQDVTYRMGCLGLSLTGGLFLPF